MLVPLRVMINDMDDSAYTYSDEILEKTLVAAAAQVLQEVSLNSSYSVDYATPQITPDPSTDDAFTALVTVKAACLKLQWDVQAKAVASGVRARCGPVSIQTEGGSANVFEALLNDSYCGAYKEMARQYNFGNTAILKGILSPFSHSEYDTGGREAVRGY